MARGRNKTINKQQYKHTAGACRICKNPSLTYEVLDVHRLKPGEDGGKYTENNVVCICCVCHRRVHDDKIKIKGWFFSTGGYLLLIEEDGVEKFV